MSPRYVDIRTIRAIEEMDDYTTKQRKSLSDDLLDAVQAQPPPPCDNRGDGRPCEHKERCETQLLACQSFLQYTLQPSAKARYEHWINAERKPSGALFNRVYKEKE